MNTFTLILKGISLYINIILWAILILGADSIADYSVPLLLIWFFGNIISSILLINIISKRELYYISFYKYLKLLFK